MDMTVKEFVNDSVAYWLHEFIIHEEVIRECQEWVIKEMESIHSRDWKAKIAAYSSAEQVDVQKLAVEKTTQWWWRTKCGLEKKKAP